MSEKELWKNRGGVQYPDFFTSNINDKKFMLQSQMDGQFIRDFRHVMKLYKEQLKSASITARGIIDYTRGILIHNFPQNHIALQAGFVLIQNQWKIRFRLVPGPGIYNNVVKNN